MLIALSTLELLSITSCHMLEYFEAPNSLKSIKYSEDCIMFNSLSESFRAITALEVLELHGCPELEAFPNGLAPEYASAPPVAKEAEEVGYQTKEKVGIVEEEQNWKMVDVCANLLERWHQTIRVEVLKHFSLEEAKGIADWIAKKSCRGLPCANWSWEVPPDLSILLYGDSL
ncbi:hypothetical protein FEM48_Zijuj11G0147800 [Ziziphus jujuba var. spinosa]|uniref:Uncharacterized protein n=1 Tax=Ziziphus jujuba var. spinosa TaxID=714518 RepID=A0A978UJJ9_ZIZJJ|nr:hypothetical protein FEM48_Zijuj11G0147800 [Ziziphus jujuba var. spinosa]